MWFSCSQFQATAEAVNVMVRSPRNCPYVFHVIRGPSADIISGKFFVFIVGPRIGYPKDAARDMALMIGIWAPTLAIMGLRAETLQRKE
jgi:hypothetical protein